METNEQHTEDAFETTPGLNLETNVLREPEAIQKTSHVPVVRQLGVALGLLVVVFGATYLGTIITLIQPKTNAQDVTVKTTLDANVLDKQVPYANAFENTKVTAESAFVWDVKAGRVLFNKNADEILPLASMTKLMTALVAYELLDATDTVSISVDAIKTSGDSGLKDGESFSVRDLTDLTLITSSNDGAAALGAATGKALDPTADPTKLFVEAMNIRAEELGLSNTHFDNATGLDLSPTEAGAYGTARDIAFLMEYVITHYPDVVALTRVDVTTINNDAGEYHLAKNTNEIVDSIDGLIASKTGFTELAGGNLVVAFEAGLDLVKRARTHVAQTDQ